MLGEYCVSVGGTNKMLRIVIHGANRSKHFRSHADNEAAQTLRLVSLPLLAQLVRTLGAVRQSILALLCVALVSPAYSTAAGLEVANPWTDANGVTWYDATSSYNGPGSTTLRILSPTSPAAVSHRFIYVLPVVEDVQLQDVYGDGLEELRALNVHNDYNAHIIAPSFKAVPWYADHDTNLERRYESFVALDLVPWVRANLSVTGQEEHWLVGFSKSGFGAVTLLFRNPTVFDATAAWDLPADQADVNSGNMLDNYGTETNFQSNYRLTNEWIAARKGPFQAATRLWISHDHATFTDQVSAFAGRLQANQVQFMRTGGATRAHSWTSGWLPEAIANLQSMRYTAQDNFNRADGGLGSNWTIDPWWGPGISVSGNQATTPVSSGGAHFWNANTFGADQFSEIKLAGAIGDWVGVSVRGQVSPRQGYWVAMKADGAYLYALLNGSFYQLAHDPTSWSTGDVLKLSVRTVDTSTARLTVYRNGTPLFTHDEVTHFIGSGYPGIGLYASTAVSLDDWQGGELSGAPEPPPTPGPSSAQDDFNRANGGLGPNWTIDPWWGPGIFVAGNQAASPIFSGGSAFLEHQHVRGGSVLRDQAHRNDRGLGRRVGPRPGVSSDRATGLLSRPTAPTCIPFSMVPSTSWSTIRSAGPPETS